MLTGMKILMGLAATFALVSCGSREPLVVKQFTLREVDKVWSEDALIQGEGRKRLYGAVSRKEREDRKGQYYSVRWRASEAGEPVRVEFAYRQASTGSQVKVLQHELQAAKTGVVEFSIAGESYRTGGRVLSWRMRLYQGEALLGEQKSFLWD